jgi:peptidoglycan/xylan/chitin deacetylase (PgdA/CDA1 family)
MSHETPRLLAAACLAALLALALPLHAEDIPPAPTALPVPVASTSPVNAIPMDAPAVAPTTIDPDSVVMELKKEPAVRINSIHVSDPYVAITFDDGPNPRNTPKLLKMLADRDIKATFFVVGEVAAENPDILRQIADQGHEIGNHSWSHPILSKKSAEFVHDELRKTDDVIRQVTGTRPTLFRPPYGAFTDDQDRTARDEFGYSIVLWSVDPLDWKKPGASAITQRIVSRTGKGSIVLAHDIHSGTVAAMPSTLDQLLAKGYQFVTVSELMRHETAEQPAPKKLAAGDTRPSAE